MNAPYVSAFPNDGKWANGYPEPGVTIRDYFAAKALQGLLAQPLDRWESLISAVAAHRKGQTMTIAQAAADASFAYADAMIAQRDKPVMP